MVSAYKNKNVEILGVSPDSVESHAKFARKYNLKITILSDPQKKVIEKYGVWGRKKFLGRVFEGVLRTTFVIDPKGRIALVFESVNPVGHAERVLKSIVKWKCGMKDLAVPVRPRTRKPGG